MTTTFRTLSLSFNLPLHPSQLDAWQYAFQQWAGWQAEEVAAYPLIQYRIWKGQATVYAVNDGVEQLQAVLAQQDWSINWQGEERQLLIEDLFMNEHHFKVLPAAEKLSATTMGSFRASRKRTVGSLLQPGHQSGFLEEKLKAALYHFFEAVGYQPAEEPVVYLQEIRRVESSAMGRDRTSKPLKLFTKVISTCQRLRPWGIANTSKKGWGRSMR
jgi:hypothetical protein